MEPQSKTTNLIKLINDNDHRSLYGLYAKVGWREDLDFSEIFNNIKNLENHSAHHLLGWMYENGEGVDRSHKLALKYYQLGADGGNPTSWNNLGFMYEHGQGVVKDYKLAFQYYQKSADQGDMSGQNNLGFMYSRGYGVDQSYELALKYLRKSVEQGDASAFLNLGWMYHYGKGVDVDYELALEYYQISINGGEAKAQNLLEELIKNHSRFISIILNKKNEEIRKLKMQIKDLKYRPGGVGYEMAKSDFEHQDKLSQN